MVYFDSGSTPALRFRSHAQDRTDLYAYANRGMADDWEAGGPVRTILRGYEDAPSGASLHLRLLAGVFRLVLTGRAPELVRFYPALGGEDPPEQAWPVMRQVIADHVDELHDALRLAPQTNEVGRSVALLVGLTDVVRASGADRVRLLEVGASAGLNLLLDHFWFTGEPSWSWGDPRSPLRFDGAVEGPFDPAPSTVAAQRGCDLDPVDATTAEGRLRLTSFVWPFMVERHRRLAAALEIAAVHPVQVDRAGASDWLETVLAEPSEPGVLDVVWQSITQMYWAPAEIVRVREALVATGETRPLAHVSMEYAADAAHQAKPEIRTSVWDGTGAGPRHRLVGTAHDHGVPVRLVAG